MADQQNPQYDLIVLGAGPGGYVAAIRAAQLGLNVACVDENEKLGGTCLRVGCIPSKALLESSELYEQSSKHFADHGITIPNNGPKLDLSQMLKRKDQVVDQLTRGIAGLFKKNKITHYQGRGRFNAENQIAVDGPDGKTQTIEAKNILIATGSTSATLPGVDLSAARIDTSTEALSYDKVPKKLAVIGAGYIGIELGSVWRRLGSEVVVFEYLDRILPGMDSDIAKEAHKLFKKQGLEFRVSSKVTGIESKSKNAVVNVEGGESYECDRVLVAVGRKPSTEGLGLNAVGIKTNERGFIEVDNRFHTNVANIYAIGDVIPGPMLAHKAEEEGIACVEGIVTGHAHMHYDSIPGVVYTHPEVASVGASEDELKEQGIDYRKGEFPYMANGRAKALNETSGKVKLLADAKTDRLLGAHILGARAGDMIAECAGAIAYGASAEDVFRTSHAHPTLAETIKEAALAVHGRTIHM